MVVAALDLYISPTPSDWPVNNPSDASGMASEDRSTNWYSCFWLAVRALRAMYSDGGAVSGRVDPTSKLDIFFRLLRVCLPELSASSVGKGITGLVSCGC